MTSRRTTAFTAVRTKGALLPAELLHRIARMDPSPPDVDAASFRLGTFPLSEGAAVLHET